MEGFEEAQRRMREWIEEYERKSKEIKDFLRQKDETKVNIRIISKFYLVNTKLTYRKRIKTVNLFLHRRPFESEKDYTDRLERKDEECFALYNEFLRLRMPDKIL